MALRTVPHVVGPVERILLVVEEEVAAIGVAQHDVAAGETLSVELQPDTMWELESTRMILAQRCLYCDAVIRVEGEPDWPLPPGRYVSSMSDCSRRLT